MIERHILNPAHFELLHTVEIPLYPREVETAKAQRGKPITPSNALKKHKQAIGIDYEWIEVPVIRKGRKTMVLHLYDIDTRQPVYKNADKVGKPRMTRIRGQDLWSLSINPHAKGKIAIYLQQYMHQFVDKCIEFPIVKYPLAICGELRDTYYDQTSLKRNGEVNLNTDWDMDNRQLFYNKVFLDVLVGVEHFDKQGNTIFKGRKFIKEDHRKYVTKPPSLIFTPIRDANKRSLIYHIYHDTREIVNNESYGKD